MEIIILSNFHQLFAFEHVNWNFTISIGISAALRFSSSVWKGQISYKQREREGERKRWMVIRVETPVERGRCPKKRGHLRGSAYEKAGQVSKKTWPFAPKLVSKWAGVKKKSRPLSRSACEKDSYAKAREGGRFGFGGRARS
jgi:hypothetical protein